MYYGSSSPYTGLPYSYSSSVSPLGSSYSASYLNPGGSYSNHSSIGSYSRAPLSSRWITSSGRNYSPMLSTISERGSASPVRINSPRRIPISSRTYGTPTYTPRPVNINTADIDVSRDKYRHKVEPPKPQPSLPQPKDSSSDESENGPFMPRVDGKPETGIDSSPGIQRSTIKRGRTVVRLYTIKRKERDSPRKPSEEQQQSEETKNEEAVATTQADNTTDEKEFMKWRKKLSEDLNYKDKKEKKSLGAKLVEKFILKDNEKDSEIPAKVQRKELGTSESLPETSSPNINMPGCLDRRCSMELLAEQANLLDSLIRSENLSTATLDLSKMGVSESINNLDGFESLKRRKSNDAHNPLKTTKSDYSLHNSLQSYKDVRDPRSFSKRRSIKKSSSGSSLRRLDSITEFPKESSALNLPAIEENRTPIKQETIKQETTKPETKIPDSTKQAIAKQEPIKPDSTKQATAKQEPITQETPQQKPKPKLKAKITASVEVSAPMSPLKFIVENVTVEEKPRIPKKKEIIFSSEVEEDSITNAKSLAQKLVTNTSKDQNNAKKIENTVITEKQLPSPEPETGNFWDKIGKRETVYLKKRKQNLDEAREKNKRALFWFPEEEEAESNEETKSNSPNESTTIIDCSSDVPNSTKKDAVDTTKHIAVVIKKEEESLKTDKNRIIKDTDIKKDDSMETISGDSIKVEAPTKENNVIDVRNKIATKTMPNSELKPSNPSEANASTLINKILSVCEENSSIGKSASLDTITENKVKISSQKKTKSEKSKKAQKESDLSGNKSLPKTNSKSKALNKSHTQQTSENINSKHIKEETAANASKETELPKIPCPIHPFGLPKVKEPILEPQAGVIEKVENVVNNNQELSETSTESETIIQENATRCPVDKKEMEEKIKEVNVEPVDMLSQSQQSKGGEKQEVSDKVQEHSTSVVSKAVVPEVLQNNIYCKNEEPKQIKETIEATNAVVEVQLHKNDSSKQDLVTENIKDDKPKPPCPIHPFGLQKVKEESTVRENTTALKKDSPLLKLETNNAKVSSDKLGNNEKSNNIDPQPSTSHDLSNVPDVKEVKLKIPSNKLKSTERSPTEVQSSDKKSNEKLNVNKTDNSTSPNLTESKVTLVTQLNKVKTKTIEPLSPDINKNNKSPNKNIIGGKCKDIAAVVLPDNKNNVREKPLVKKDSFKSEEPSTSGVILNKPTSAPITILQKSPDENSKNDSSLHTEVKTLNVPEIPVVLESQNIPNEKIESKTVITQEKTGEENKAENTTQKDQEKEKPIEEAIKAPTPKRPVKEEKAVKPLIATPRPLQKKAPQVIHSSDSSDTSSEEESSEEEDDSDSSEDSTEFFECDNNPDGRTSTGSNDSGFDSSAPASPATFSQIKKGKLHQ